MRLSFRYLILVLIFFALGGGVGSAEEKVWVGLYLAENGQPPVGTELAPEKLGHRLREVFGFKHYELVKEEGLELGGEWEQWFVPRRDFFIRVNPLPRQPGEPRQIDYEIYKDGFIVAKGKYEPHRDTPLFINGPDFHEGRLLLVVEARSESFP
jgi:hypothetical protein